MALKEDIERAKLPTNTRENKMSMYHSTISAATGVTDKEMLEEIEESMRHDIFHSTLDWQTEEQLSVAAIEAKKIVDYSNSPEGIAEYEAYLASWSNK
jgi:hypothetical protein